MKSKNTKTNKTAIQMRNKKVKKGLFSPVRTAQDTLPYLNVYRSGIIESTPGFFTKCYKLEDMKHNKLLIIAL